MEAENLFTRYVDKVYPSVEALQEALNAGRKLTFYLGIDPTGPHVHIGHSTNLLWLKHLHARGHRIIFLIGDFTARVGDPDKVAARQALSVQQVRDNMQSYLGQVYKILPEGSFALKYNSEWLAKLNFESLIELASHLTVQQMIARDMFRGRLKKQKPIYLHEFFYPLMQGYDSVAMDVDGEVGGDDQTFNMLVGRDLMRVLKNKEKFVVTTKLLEDPDTGKKIMNKSEGNVISLDDEPQEIRRKVLMLDDRVIATVFELCTEKDLGWIGEHARGKPRQFKEELAEELVRMYHGEGGVGVATQDKEVAIGGKFLDKGLVALGIVPTMSAAHQLIDQGGVEINDQKVKEWKYILKKGDRLRVGKGKFLKVS